jgi:hypothetical protein
MALKGRGYSRVLNLLMYDRGSNWLRCAHHFLQNFDIKQPTYLEKLYGEKITRSDSHTWAPLSTVQMYRFEGGGQGRTGEQGKLLKAEYRTLILILILDAAHEKG